MGETRRPINLTQWRGINYGATTSSEDSRFTGKSTPCCSSSSHCLRKDGEYWYEAKTCFPCVLDPKDYFIRKVPFIKWLRRYSPPKFLSDVIAGMTVGLMVVPQALAYAKIAGLPLEYGLYSAFMGCFVYIFLGTSKDVTLGPTAIMSLIVSSILVGNGVATASYPLYAVALCFLCGIIQLAMGLLNLGFIVDFIPPPIISGFTSAAAITIATGQLKSLFGIDESAGGGGVNGTSTVHTGLPLIDTLIKAGTFITTAHVWDIVLGLCSIALCLTLKFGKLHIEKLSRRRGNPLDGRIALKLLWILFTANNAVVVLLGALLAFSLCAVNQCKAFTLISDVSPGLPAFTIPHLDLDIIKIRSVALNLSRTEPHFGQGLNVGIAVAPLIGFLESIAIAKAFARKNNYRIDPSQELIAIGVGNVAGSFVQSYPITGSFSRTAVNSQSGAETPLAGLFTGAIVLLALGVLTPWFQYIPETSLAAIIITAVLHMVDFKMPLAVWKISKMDLLPLVVSFLGTLFLDIKTGVPVACAVHVLILLYRHARPRHKVFYPPSVIYIMLNGGLNYPGADFIIQRIKHELDRSQMGGAAVKSVVLDGSHMPEIDYTVVHSLDEVVPELNESYKVEVTIIAQPRVVHVLEKAQSRKFFNLVSASLQPHYSSDRCSEDSVDFLERVEA